MRIYTENVIYTNCTFGHGLQALSLVHGLPYSLHPPTGGKINIVKSIFALQCIHQYFVNNNNYTITTILLITYFYPTVRF